MYHQGQSSASQPFLGGQQLGMGHPSSHLQAMQQNPTQKQFHSLQPFPQQQRFHQLFSHQGYPQHPGSAGAYGEEKKAMAPMSHSPHYMLQSPSGMGYGAQQSPAGGHPTAVARNFYQQQFQQQHYQKLKTFWAQQLQDVRTGSVDFNNHAFPLARIKKIMKSDEEVRVRPPLSSAV